MLRKGIGQYTSGACQYQVPGIAPDPGIPFCGPGGYQMTPAQIASVLASQKAGGYSDVSSGAFSSSAPQQLLPASVAQSNAPNTAVVGSSGTPAQSNAANTSYAIPATGAAAKCFALFSGEPCAGPVGLYTLLAGAAAAFAALKLLGGR